VVVFHDEIFSLTIPTYFPNFWLILQQRNLNAQVLRTSSSAAPRSSIGETNKQSENRSVELTCGQTRCRPDAAKKTKVYSLGVVHGESRPECNHSPHTGPMYVSDSCTYTHVPIFNQTLPRLTLILIALVIVIQTSVFILLSSLSALPL